MEELKGGMGLGLGIQGGLGLIQSIIGGIGAARLAKREPKYEIPKEVGEAISLAKGMAAEGMPAAQRVAAEQGIQQSALLGLSAAQSRRGGLMSAQNIQATTDRSLLNLASQDAAMRQQNQRFAYSALMAGASYADKAFANRWQSWSNRMQQNRALLGAGIQNIAGAGQSLMYSSMYGQGGSGGGVDDNIILSGTGASGYQGMNMTPYGSLPSRTPGNVYNVKG